MSLHRIVLFALVTVLAAPSSAFAQDDDLLAPLTPQKSAGTKSGKTKVVKKKKPAREKPAKVTKKPAKPKSGATARGKAGKKPVEAAEDEDLLAPLALKKTELLVRITGGVRGAKLQVDGKDAGSLSAAPVPLEVTPGEHLLVVRKPGYAEYTRRIDVKEGAQQEVAVSLDATMGFATLTADVAEAVVVVDGDEIGPVPQGNVLLKPGSREIEFRAPGFKPDVHNITVFAGRNYAVEGTLRPLVDTSVATRDAPRNPVLDPSRTDDAAPGLTARDLEPDTEVSSGKPWYGRWYVWAGVGAVVAAGTVGAVMATQSGSPAALSKEVVCGGPCDGSLGGARSVRGNANKAGGGLLRLPAGALRF